MAETTIQYPAGLEVDYPERLDRLTTFFRLFMAIPILILLGFLIGSYHETYAGDNLRIMYGGGGIVFIPTLLMILFRKKYPKWWFDWNLELTRFIYRVFIYLLLLRDEYPSTDEEQALHLNIAYPDAEKELSRGMPLIKWFLALPHVIILGFLYTVLVLCTFFAWFAILFTGKYPRGLFDFIVGILRWSLRVSAYALLLTTDRYPPFGLN